MYLAAVEECEALPRDGLASTALASAPWDHCPFSSLAHHGDSCCEVAREWVLAMDFAQLNGGDLLAGPRWLREKYEWGPSPWPMAWCELVGRKVIDCGAYAALAHEAFTARGVTAFRAQFVQRYSPDALAQWRGKWSEDRVSDHWIGEDVIYHEGVAVMAADEDVKLWDASAGWWIEPRQAGGYGSLAAVRVFADGQWGGGDGLRWGEHRLKPGIWHQVAA
ncbi:MAG TPA: hypothetical protein VN231_07690 [Allosphingosinicella sp.]|nr:hypothetical protein [Allosphingosinicella sp.]